MYRILLCTLNTPLEKITTLFTVYCDISQAEKTLDVRRQTHHENPHFLLTSGPQIPAKHLMDECGGLRLPVKSGKKTRYTATTRDGPYVIVCDTPAKKKFPW